MAGLNIALCITDLDVGGAEQALVALAARLDRSRFTARVYCLGPEPPRPDASCVPALRAAGVAVECLGAKRCIDFPRTVGRLAGCFRRQRPDVVQTFLFHANLVGRIAARWAGVPKVVCGIRVAERHARWHLWLDRWTARWVDRYVCVSDGVARFSANAGLPPQRIVVIPNGVDATQYEDTSPGASDDLGLPPGQRLVTFVGRLEPQKGVRWLLETASEWLARLPDCDLVLVGRGPDRPALERFAADRGIASRVHFLGWRSDVPRLLRASELLVLPSRWEGMPNVVLQAMASGLPVLATDVEGVTELLESSTDAQMVAYGDTAGFVARIVRLLSDRQLAQRLGQENRRRVERSFSIRQTVIAYQDLWASLAAGLA